MSNNNNIEVPPLLNTCISTNFIGSMEHPMADRQEKKISYHLKGDEEDDTIFFNNLH